MPLLDTIPVQEVLARAGMPARVAAEQAGLTYDAFHNILSGRQSASVEAAYRLASAFRFPASRLHPGLMPDPRCARTARQRRQVLGLRRGELADRLGMTPGRLSAIEAGGGKPVSKDSLWRLAQFFGCAPRDIAPPGTPPWTLEQLAEMDAEAEAEPERVLAAAAR